MLSEDDSDRGHDGGVHGRMIINSMQGLGDNIYQRAFVRELPKPVWINTPWPELYGDIPGVNFVKPVTRLRTQAKNVVRSAVKWVKAPRGLVKQIHYGSHGIIPGMRRQFGVVPKVFDLPNYGPSPVEGRYAVVRPVTVRSEWLAEARNPLPEYINQAAETVREKGYKVVSIADLEDGKEWSVGPLPAADIVFHMGELDLNSLMALIAGASAVIGGIGWILPAAIAYKVPALVICGGWGKYNSPEKLIHPPMDTSNLTFAVPDNFCMCAENDHQCDKRILDYESKLANWVERLPALV